MGVSLSVGGGSLARLRARCALECVLMGGSTYMYSRDSDGWSHDFRWGGGLPWASQPISVQHREIWQKSSG